VSCAQRRTSLPPFGIQIPQNPSFTSKRQTRSNLVQIWSRLRPALTVLDQIP